MFRLLSKALLKSERLHEPKRHRTPLRRESFVVAMAAASRPTKPTTTLDEGNEETPQAFDSLTTTSTSHQSIDSSQFASQFARHVDRRQQFFDNSRGWRPQEVKHTQTSEQQLPQHHQEHVSALAALDTQAVSRRELFASSTPSVRLRKSSAMYRKELAQVLRQDELRLDALADVEGGSLRSSPRPSKFVEVPLLPPAYLRQRALKHANGHVADDGDEDAERLQLAAARNVLAQSNEQQLFRCLRCFHIFNAKPQTLLREAVEQMHLEVDAQERNRSDADRISRRPGLRKALHSVGRQQAAARADPKGCPSCGSNRVQWAMEYIHHKTHHKVKPHNHK